jgi:hypothetical protein
MVSKANVALPEHRFAGNENVEPVAGLQDLKTGIAPLVVALHSPVAALRAGLEDRFQRAGDALGIGSMRVAQMRVARTDRTATAGSFRDGGDDTMPTTSSVPAAVACFSWAAGRCDPGGLRVGARLAGSGVAREIALGRWPPQWRPVNREVLRRERRRLSLNKCEPCALGRRAPTWWAKSL